MNAEQIKNVFYTEISDLIGTYKLNERSLPAVWIGKPPSLIDRQGLELLITVTPLSQIKQGQIIRRIWEVILVQNNAERVNIHTAIDRIIQVPGVIKSNFIPARNNKESNPNYQFLDTCDITYADFQHLSTF
jgi:hypothetical protein